MATSKNTRQPTGHIAPFGLRLQPELKARAEESAARYGRSLNAEIVHVLQNYYDQQDRESHTVDEAMAGSDFASLADHFDAPPVPQLPELRIALDAGDQPISWDEINEYMRAIRKAMAINDVILSVRVLAGDLVSSSDREAETAKLAKKLRKPSK